MVTKGVHTQQLGAVWPVFGEAVQVHSHVVVLTQQEHVWVPTSNRAVGVLNRQSLMM